MGRIAGLVEAFHWAFGTALQLEWQWFLFLQGFNEGTCAAAASAEFMSFMASVIYDYLMGTCKYKPVLVEDDFIENIFWGWRGFEASGLSGTLNNVSIVLLLLHKRKPCSPVFWWRELLHFTCFCVKRTISRLWSAPEKPPEWIEEKSI